MPSAGEFKRAVRDRLVSAGWFVDADYWAIGMCEGTSPTDLRPVADAWPALGARDVSDVDATFVADPFMVRSSDSWHMFFEVMNRTSGRGEIGHAVSQDAVRWHYDKIVLAQSYHLSFPHVLEWNGAYYMVPETVATGRVELYVATDFPHRWDLHSVLLEGRSFQDTAIFGDADRWWMLTETSDGPQFDTLRVYYADDLVGPWREHPRSPVRTGDATVSRPAGRVVRHGAGWVRFAQDCAGVYGRAVRAFKIIELTPETYADGPVGGHPVLGPSPSGWNDAGMHHIDAHEVSPGRWLACVDGRPQPGLRRRSKIPSRQRPWTRHERPGPERA